MNKETTLTVSLALLSGFVAGYILRDVMAARQPQRALPGQTAVAASPHAGGPGAPTVGVPPASPASPAPGGLDGANPAAMEDIQRLREQVENNPNDADAVLQLANLNFDIRNWPRAIELYQRYLTLRPDSPNTADVRSDLGVCLYNQKQFKEALAVFDDILATRPDHWQSRFNQVVVLALGMGDFAEAERRLEALRAVQPNNPDVERLAAEVARQKGGAS